MGDLGHEDDAFQTIAGGVPVSHAESAGRRLHAALAACPSLSEGGEPRDALWLTVQDVVCSKATLIVAPHGSANPVEVTSEYATNELIAAMEWLTGHEATARRLSPTGLYSTLRGQAMRGGHGSARAAQADLLHGMTEVPAGSPVTWCELEESGAA
jgi:hypothetical protein